MAKAKATAKKRAPRRKKTEPKPPDPVVLENEPEEDELAAREVKPRVEEDAHQRYESQPRRDIFTISRESYDSIREFLSSRGDRDTWSVALFRADPEWPENRKLWKYIPGQMPMPDGMLEDAVNRKHGPGVYRWQLCKDGKYAGQDMLPPTLRGTSLNGWVSISQEDADDDDEVEMHGMPSGALGTPDVLLEIIRSGRHDAQQNSAQMVDILRANADAFKVQMEVMVKQMEAQNTFLQAQLERDREESRRRQEEKDGMWKEIVGLVRDMRDGDGRSTVDRVIDGAVPLVRELAGAGMFKVPSTAPVPTGATPPPGAAPPPPPAQPNQPEMPQRPAQGLTDEERNNPVFMYVASLVNKLWQLYTGQVDIDLAAEQLERIGSDEEFDWLLQQGTDTVLQAVDGFHARFKSGPAPKELLDYTRAVYAAIQEDNPADTPEDGSAPPVTTIPDGEADPQNPEPEEHASEDTPQVPAPSEEPQAPQAPQKSSGQVQGTSQGQKVTL